MPRSASSRRWKQATRTGPASLGCSAGQSKPSAAPHVNRAAGSEHMIDHKASRCAGVAPAPPRVGEGLCGGSQQAFDPLRAAGHRRLQSGQAPRRLRRPRAPHPIHARRRSRHQHRITRSGPPMYRPQPPAPAAERDGREVASRTPASARSAAGGAQRCRLRQRPGHTATAAVEQRAVRAQEVSCTRRTRRQGLDLRPCDEAAGRGRAAAAAARRVPRARRRGRDHAPSLSEGSRATPGYNSRLPPPSQPSELDHVSPESPWTG